MHEPLQPSPWSILPFVLLLGTIALAPLVAPKFWHRHYPKVALVLAAVTLAYYLAGLHAYGRVLHVAQEYLTFIVLVGSLFVVSGGIQLTVKGEGEPLQNVGFLFFGALLANVIGTTGASMLLIRPWIRFNRYRITAFHIVFFIFLVSNVGGTLTPIGDPPLFLGYLKGMPFWWIGQQAWLVWLVAVGLLLAIFYVLDAKNYRRAPGRVRAEHAEGADQWQLTGLHNFCFLLVILAAVFVSHPPLVREGLMVLAGAGSWFTTRPAIRHANEFSWDPIREVAILFVGIFATMIPALDWLETNAGLLIRPTAASFYWGTGALSAFLDNAPTFLSFLSAEIGSTLDPAAVAQFIEAARQGPAALAATTNLPVVEVFKQYHAGELASGILSPDHTRIAFLLAHPERALILVATCVGAVFFGACTYIGNGPNFLVKSIADQQKIHMPTFLGYVFRYTVPFLLPVLVVVWWLFFRGATRF